MKTKLKATGKIEDELQVVAIEDLGESTELCLSQDLFKFILVHFCSPGGMYSPHGGLPDC